MGNRADNAWKMAEELVPVLSDAIGDFLGATVVIAAVCPRNGALEMHV